MATILQSLKVSSVQRNKQQSPVQNRRVRLVKIITEQITAATAVLNGERFSVTVDRRMRDKVTGEVSFIEKSKRFRQSWWVAEDGKNYLEIRYGCRCLEIAKGKTTIEVGDSAKLIPTLELLRDAALVGELDEQLNTASSRLAERLRSKRAAAKTQPGTS